MKNSHRNINTFIDGFYFTVLPTLTVSMRDLRVIGISLKLKCLDAAASVKFFVFHKSYLHSSTSPQNVLI